MADSIKPEDFSKALADELGVYTDDLLDRVNGISKDSADELVRLTRATAPVGARGVYHKKIASKIKEKSKTGNVYVWYVKDPDYRLTHLLVYGHQKRDGDRTNPNDFLKNAVDDVLPRYEKKIEEALT